ncbi:MAG: hypothetical protein LBD35_00310 [Prevotellaceae bacterium]|nr:hypothetical protein [Prevotellaceae bacterium]
MSVPYRGTSGIIARNLPPSARLSRVSETPRSFPTAASTVERIQASQPAFSLAVPKASGGTFVLTFALRIAFPQASAGGWNACVGQS